MITRPSNVCYHYVALTRYTKMAATTNRRLDLFSVKITALLCAASPYESIVNTVLPLILVMFYTLFNFCFTERS